MEKIAEKKTPEKPVAVTPSKPVITPKTVLTKSKDLTEEEFFALLGGPTTPATNPNEIKAPEKKEDM